MGATFTYAAVYRVEAECRTPLRTGSTDGDPEQVLRDRDGNAFIQGSSLSGALRGWLTSELSQALAGALFGNRTRTNTPVPGCASIPPPPPERTVGSLMWPTSPREQSSTLTSSGWERRRKRRS